MAETTEANSNACGAKRTATQFWLPATIIAISCAFFAFAVISHIRLTSATHDETVHLPSGYAYLAWHDFRMNPEHPPLIKELAALPLLFLHVWPSQIDINPEAPQMETSPTLRALQLAWAMGLVNMDAEWLYGHYFLYGVRDEALRRDGSTHPLQLSSTAKLTKSDFFNDADRLLFWGRMPMLLLGLLLAVLIFSWARELYGIAGGVLALTFYCFDPNFIAHSGFVTTDVGVSAFMFGAIYFLWRTWQRFGAKNVLMTAIFFAAAIASKFSGVLLLPIFAAVGLVCVCSIRKWPIVGPKQRAFSSPLEKGLAFGGLTLIALLASYALLWAVYGFRYSAASDPARAGQLEELVMSDRQQDVRESQSRQPGSFPLQSILRRSMAIKSLLKERPDGNISEDDIERSLSDARVGLTGQMALLVQRYHLLPEAYLFGFALANTRSQFWGSFLLGRYSNRGWWYYFPIAFALKTPLLTLVSIAAAMALIIRRRFLSAATLAFLLLPVLLYLAVAMTSHLNIGHRHILPIYPFLFVLCGGLVVEWRKWRDQYRGPLAAVALVAVALSSSVVFAPPWKPVVVYPDYLAYFNEFAGGPRNGYMCLVDSNLDWGQDLKKLKHWLDQHKIDEPINLCYFGTADPRFHQIPHMNLPNSYRFELQELSQAPQIPGYLAISATTMQGMCLSAQGCVFWARLLQDAEFIDTVGYSIFIYKLRSPPQ